MTGTKVQTVGELTARQREIVDTIIDDPDATEVVIAERLGIKKSSIRSHVHNICVRTGSTSIRAVAIKELRRRQPWKLYAVHSVNGSLVVEPLEMQTLSRALYALAVNGRAVVDENVCRQLRELQEK